MLKKTLLLLTLVSGISLAQVNPDFENWTGNNPDGWISFNIFPDSFNIPQTVFQDNLNPPSGSFATKIQTVLCSTCVEDSILTDTVVTGVLTQFVPYSGQPDSVYISLKHNPQAGDSGFMSILFSHAGPNGRVIDGGGTIPFVLANNWTRYAIPFTYGPNANLIDSVRISFESSFNRTNPRSPSSVGSELFVDHILFSSPVGLEDIFNQVDAKVYPNPASSNLFIEVEAELVDRVEIYTVGGVLVHSQSINNFTTTVAVNELSSGQYMYVLKNEKDIIVKRDLFNIAR